MPADENGAISAASRLVEALVDADVEVVFGLPGVHNLPLWRALRDSKIRLVGVRHEQTAVYAADGFARATGRLGVALVTSGPGAANTLGAMGEAMASGSPVVVVATDIPASLRRDGVYRGVLHETRDQRAMFVPVTKFARLSSASDSVAPDFRLASQTAMAAPRGPGYLGIPTDFLDQPTQPPGPNEPLPSAAPNFERLEDAITLAKDANRPLIWVGGGAVGADAGASVGDLALKLDAPVICTFMARGILGDEHPCLTPGPPHAPEVGALWDEADLIIAIGSDFDGMMTQNWAMPAPKSLLAINIDAIDAGKNYAPDLVLEGDARAGTDALATRISDRGDMRQAISERLAPVRQAVAAAVEADDPEAAALLDTFNRTLPEDTIVVADMCIPGYWLAGYWQPPAPRRLAYPVGWGTLGFAFPASIGACFAGDAPVVCVCGDGGFLFACGELATAVQHQVDLTVVIVDDGGYGMLRFDQQVAGEEPFGVDLQRPNFANLARSFGVPAVTVTEFGGDFERALQWSLSTSGPAAVVVKCQLKPPPTTSPRWYRRIAASEVE